MGYFDILEIVFDIFCIVALLCALVWLVVVPFEVGEYEGFWEAAGAAALAWLGGIPLVIWLSQFPVGWIANNFS